ncbi:MAG: hypothetical protein ACOC2V_06255 [Alkalispirochaeta sp.]
MDPIGSTSLSDSTIDVGFVGLGRIASILEDDPLREKPATHAGAVTAHPRCRIAGGFDLLRERREGFAKRWSVPVDSGIDQLLARRPGILVIATDPDRLSVRSRWPTGTERHAGWLASSERPRRGSS